MGEVRTETISYSPQKLTGFLAVPDGRGPFPALVVIHEWWGLNEQIKSATRDLAGAGYVALAVDLYRGTVTASFDEAPRMAKSLPPARAVSDLNEAVKFLASRQYVKGEKIGSVGWCMGGGYSLALALSNPAMAATVIYYGHLVTDPAEVSKIPAPVIGFFGQEDRSPSPGDVRAFEAALQKAGKKISTYIYPGAGHAFANPTRTDAYRPEATKDSWARMMEFLKNTLG
jgi:carboxymethylenebutenolidase